MTHIKCTSCVNRRTIRMCSIHDVGRVCEILVQGDIAMKRVTQTHMCVYFVIMFAVNSLCLNLN